MPCDFSGIKAVVIGDTMADVYFRGQAERLSPEAPVPVVKLEEEEMVLGGAGNVSANLASLGCQTVICTMIGDDEQGFQVDRLFSERGIAAHVVSPNGYITTTKYRVIANKQQVVRFDREVFRRSFQEFVNHTLSIIKEFCPHVVILSDYGKGVVTEELAIAVIHQNTAPVFVDPKDGEWDCYSGAFCIKPNWPSLDKWTKGYISYFSIFNLMEKYRWQNLLLTLGEKGMELYHKGWNNPKAIPAISRPVYDLSGAGDTAMATLAACFPTYGIEKAAELANAAASIVVGKPGTAVITEEELNSVF